MYQRIFNLVAHLRVLSIIVGSVTLVACGSKPTVYTQESFSVDSPYKSRLESNSTIACESARRVLLGDGYVIDTYNQDSIKGRKAYRSDSDGSTFIEMNIVCIQEPDASMVYANGLLSTYVVKRSSGSASVGVSAIGSVSLPFGQSADSMVKTSDETIRDPEFYRRFFNVVNIVMARIKKAEEDIAAQAKQTQSEEPEQLPDTSTPVQQADHAEPQPVADKPTPAEQLPPTPQVEPARTAEALQEAEQKRPEKVDSEKVDPEKIEPANSDPEKIDPEKNDPEKHDSESSPSAAPDNLPQAPASDVVTQPEVHPAAAPTPSSTPTVDEINISEPVKESVPEPIPSADELLQPSNPAELSPPQ